MVEIVERLTIRESGGSWLELAILLLPALLWLIYLSFLVLTEPAVNLEEKGGEKNVRDMDTF